MVDEKKDLEEKNMSEDMKAYRDRKITLLSDLDKIITVAHNEHLLHYPDIVGCMMYVLFDYQMQCRTNLQTIETQKDNDDRGVFI